MNPHLELRCRHGMGEEISLCVIASCRNEQIALFGSFHAFRNHPHREFMSHRDNGVHNGPITGALDQAADKGAIDLDEINGKFVQVRHGGEASSEIVQRRSELPLDSRTSATAP